MKIILFFFQWHSIRFCLCRIKPRYLLQNVVTRSHRITRSLASIGVHIVESTRLACTVEMNELGWDVETNDAQ